MPRLSRTPRPSATRGHHAIRRPGRRRRTARRVATGLDRGRQDEPPELGLRPVTENVRFGATRNPWQPGLSAGARRAAARRRSPPAWSRSPTAATSAARSASPPPAVASSGSSRAPAASRSAPTTATSTPACPRTGVRHAHRDRPAVALDAIAGYEPGDRHHLPTEREPVAAAAQRDPGRVAVRVALNAPLGVPVDHEPRAAALRREPPSPTSATTCASRHPTGTTRRSAAWGTFTTGAVQHMLRVLARLHGNRSTPIGSGTGKPRLAGRPGARHARRLPRSGRASWALARRIIRGWGDSVVLTPAPGPAPRTGRKPSLTGRRQRRRRPLQRLHPPLERHRTAGDLAAAARDRRRCPGRRPTRRPARPRRPPARARRATRAHRRLEAALMHGERRVPRIVWPTGVQAKTSLRARPRLGRRVASRRTIPAGRARRRSGRACLSLRVLLGRATRTRIRRQARRRRPTRHGPARSRRPARRGSPAPCRRRGRRASSRTAEAQGDAPQRSPRPAGLMHSDHLHPGSNRRRAAVVPPSRTTSTVVLSGVRVSSGEPKSRASTPAIRASLVWRQGESDDPDRPMSTQGCCRSVERRSRRDSGRRLLSCVPHVTRVSAGRLVAAERLAFSSVAIYPCAQYAFSRSRSRSVITRFGSVLPSWLTIRTTCRRPSPLEIACTW